MQHEIEDKGQLLNLENAWKQVESKHNAHLESTIVEVLNSINKESMQVVNSNEKENEVVHEDFDTDEYGSTKGGSWIVIEVNTEFQIQCSIPLELNAKLQQMDKNEILNVMNSLLRAAFSSKSQSPIDEFIKNLEEITGVELEKIERIEYESETGDLNLVVVSVNQEDSSQEATTDHRDSGKLERDPHKYYGVSPSDFV